jgi:hypothetical protein
MSASASTITVGANSNAYGTKYVQSTAPTSPCNGDVWYDTSGTAATGGEFPSNTVLLFYQASAPTGWTQVTTQNNKALRVVSGTGGGSGGSTEFTSVFTSRTDIPLLAHTHGYGFAQGTSTAINNGFNGISGVVYQGSVAELEQSGGNDGQRLAAFSASVASSGTASPTMNFAVQYIDIIMCRKN